MGEDAAAGSTAWAPTRETPLRRFLRTETGSAAVLLVASLAALGWANLGGGSYRHLWETDLSIHLGGLSLGHSLVYWVNSGLMTLFFFVVGLEARREFDMGELRERRRLAIPLTTGVAGMVVPVGIYLVFNAGHRSVLGWGVAMSTDTAFALAVLAVVGPGLPDRVRSFLLTFSVVDDVASLAVIATVYSHGLHLVPLLLALVVLGIVVVLARRHVGGDLVLVLAGAVIWVALSDSGVDPVVGGLALGLVTYAAPAARVDLERASRLFRLFREQPTAELARSAQIGLASAVSSNDRLQRRYHPVASYVIVPLFALANVGIPLDGGVLGRAFASPVTLGILVGYVVGKPIGVLAGSAIVTRLTGGKVPLPVGWASLAGGGAIAGIGFTVSLLVASLAFRGVHLEEAKIGVLSAAVCAALASWLVFRATAMLPRSLRWRAVLGTAEAIIDLAVPVDPARDHIRGPGDAPVTLVEYGDLECPYCGRAEPVVRSLLADFGDLRYVWRHLPLLDVHPYAQLAAEATEAAGAQGRFWEMHDQLFEHPDALGALALVGHAARIGLDVARFRADLERHAGAIRIAEDVDGADRSGVSGTPTFFVNGRRYQGAFDLDSLANAVRVARASSGLVARSSLVGGRSGSKRRWARHDRRKGESS